jgi:hypothetical protein
MLPNLSVGLLPLVCIVVASSFAVARTRGNAEAIATATATASTQAAVSSRQSAATAFAATAASCVRNNVVETFARSQVRRQAAVQVVAAL